MAFENIQYEKTDSVLKITLNRPEYRNAESSLMSQEWFQAFKDGEEDDDVRVIILAGAGKDFSSGHDLGTPQQRAWMEERAKTPQRAMGAEATTKGEDERWLKSALYVRDIWKPTIAQVQGHCIMGGLILATMCDLIIASEDATFQDMAVRFGVPSVEYFSHPWELGIRKTKEFLFTGDAITAQEAHRLGMVNRVVPLENLEEETMKLAQRIALAHPFALKVVKMATNATMDIMGHRTSMLPQFILHQLGHAHSRENPDYNQMSRARSGQPSGSVKDMIQARDREYNQPKK